jgi:hypothetical protein
MPNLHTMMNMMPNVMYQAAAGGAGAQQPHGQYDYSAPEVNYWHQREYDFDESDRPMAFPNETYSKSIYPVTRDTQVSTPLKDWEAICPNSSLSSTRSQK